MNRPASAGQIGTGAIATDIQRARDMFLDTQWRTEAGGLANADESPDALEQVEVMLDEPQGVGLSSLFNEYYRVWNELSNDPSASALPVRTTVVQQSLSLTDAFNRIAGQLVTIRTGLDSEIRPTSPRSTTSPDQILADQQTRSSRSRSPASPRTTSVTAATPLMDRLLELVNVTSTENADGSINVLMGAQVLVNGTTAKTDLFGGRRTPATATIVDITVRQRRPGRRRWATPASPGGSPPATRWSRTTSPSWTRSPRT